MGQKCLVGQPVDNSVEVIRQSHLAEKVVFIDGQPGCGKSMFSAIVAAFDRVEKLNIAYEIEYVCALKHLKRIEPDAAIALVRMFTDLKLYDLMMCRETNFRPSDVSSVFRAPRPFRYIKRLFMKGNEAIPGRIANERPILHLTTHNILSFAEPVFAALGSRAVIIEIVRHPLYMIKQQTFNMEQLLSDVRDFTIYFSYKDKQLPYFTCGWEDMFIRSNPVEKAILCIERLNKTIIEAKKSLFNKYNAQILTIPFESFVINPYPYLTRIEKITGTTRTSVLRKVMKKQKVPRKMYANGMSLPIYKRCGWEPAKHDSDENKEFAHRRAFAAERVSTQALEVLDRICAEYEQEYLGGRQNY